METASSVKFLLSKPENLSVTPQNPHKRVECGDNNLIRPALGRERQEVPWGSVAGHQHSLLGKHKRCLVQ